MVRVSMKWILVLGLGSLCLQAEAGPGMQQKKAASTKAKASVLTQQEKAQHMKWQKYLSDPQGAYAYYPKEMCGKNIPTFLDENITPSFMKAGNDAAIYCEEIRTKLSTMCRNSADLKNDNKNKINKLVNKITCKPGSAEDEATFKLINGELQVFLGAKASNISEKLLEFMDNATL